MSAVALSKRQKLRLRERLYGAGVMARITMLGIGLALVLGFIAGRMSAMGWHYWSHWMEGVQ